MFDRGEGIKLIKVEEILKMINNIMSSFENRSDKKVVLKLESLHVRPSST